MVTMIALLGLVFAGAAVGSATAADPSRNEREAEAHYLKALACLEQQTLDHRRQSLRELEEAVRLAPENATYRLALANLHFFGGYYHTARRGFERVAAADSADAYLSLGLLWRRQWMASGERVLLDRAVDAIMAAAWLAPAKTDTWLLLVPLYLAQDEREDAASAAFSALESDPERLEARLAVAATLCHLGVVGLGDSIFRATIPRLPMDLRARFEATAPLPGELLPAIASSAAAHDHGEGGSGGPASAAGRLEPGLEERLWLWSRLTVRSVLVPAAERNAEGPPLGPLSETGPPLVVRSGQVAPPFDRSGGGPGQGRARGVLWESPDLGLRMEILGRLLACRPILPDSRSGDGAATSSGALATLYARVLAVLGTAETEGSRPGSGARADTGD